MIKRKGKQNLLKVKKVQRNLILEVALGDSDDHVGDVRADGSDGGQLLAEAEPLFDLQGLLVNLGDVDLQVAEALGQSSPGTGHSHGASLDAALDPVRDCNLLTDVDSLHPQFL